MTTQNQTLSPFPLAISKGGTSVTSVTTAPTASRFAGWDANSNLSANNCIEGYRTTATAAGTTVLTVADAFQQYFTGSTTQTVTLPVTSTLVTGQSFYIVNNSSGIVTVQSSGANTIQAMAGSTTLLVTCISTSGTTAASWNAVYLGAASGGTVNSGTANQLAYYASTGSAVSGLATANNGFLVTNGSGVPSISSTVPAFTTSSITFSPTTGGIVGTTTNDSAAAGKVGEYISASVQVASAVALTSTVEKTITSISLTAGDWDVTGSASFVTNTGTTVNYIGSSISLTNNSIDGTVGSRNLLSYGGQVMSNFIGQVDLPLTTVRISIASTTTVYLVAAAGFGTSTMSGAGIVRARRVR